jgi:two-component system, OmpR family, KDP operon response regulator KdpE
MAGSILLVEDDATLVRSIERNLVARGYSIRVAETVAGARRLLSEECPSLLLLDIDLPDGSGWEVLRAMRGFGCDKAAVIVVTALRANPRLVEEFGCHAVLEKPFPMDSLVRLVHDCVGRSATNGLDRAQ